MNQLQHNSNAFSKEECIPYGIMTVDRFIVFSFDLCDCLSVYLLSIVRKQQLLRQPIRAPYQIPDSFYIIRNSVVGPQTSLLRTFPSAVADPGGGSGDPDPPIRPYACLRLKFLHQQDHHNFISFFNCLIFFMKCRLHFATKLNSRDIQKCKCF